LDTQIQLQLDKEEAYERQEQINNNPTVGLPNIADRYFKRINMIIKKYLTPRLLKMQHRQMNESLLYRVKKSKIGKIFLIMRCELSLFMIFIGIVNNLTRK